jgi:hypothetical protein
MKGSAMSEGHAYRSDEVHGDKRESRTVIGETGFAHDAQLTVYDANEVSWAAHVDDGGTLHWFAVTKTMDDESEAHELRYFRALENDDHTFRHDSYRVMPVPGGDPASAWALPDLERSIVQGDIYDAQQLAYDIAAAHGLEFPHPLELPELDPEPEYYFGLGTGPNNQPSLEAVKTWMHGSERRFDTFTIAEYGHWDEARTDERELNQRVVDESLQAALNFAETMAVAGGYLDPKREDGRVFFETDAPDDPFISVRERELATPERDPDETQELPAVPAENFYADWAAEWERKRLENAPLAGASWFEATFAKREAELLQPLDDTVNYAVAIAVTDPFTSELMVEKYWREAQGFIGYAALTIATYDPDEKSEQEIAQAARRSLLELHEQRGLEAMMWRAELDAMTNGHLDGDRVDRRLFQDGPPDRFETLAQRLEGEINPYWNISGEWIESPFDETQELPTVAREPGSWDALVAQQQDLVASAQESHYWQMHHRPVETPDGDRLGTALFVTEFPQLPPDFGEYVEEWGIDDTIYPTEARTLEMAHFDSEQDACKFEAEFRGYLVPGLLEGPDLAPEVAKLEGLSGEWRTMDFNAIVDYMSGSRTINHEESDWHLHHPNAEREAQERLETPQTDIDF